MHAIAHNKIIIIDGTTVVTGSFNFTKAADQKNAENLLVIRDDKVAAKYEANWQAHAATGFTLLSNQNASYNSPQASTIVSWR